VREGKGTAVIKRFLAAWAASMVVLGAGAGSALADYPPAMQAGAVSATTVVPGGQVSFGGGGFRSGSKVVVKVNKVMYATVSAGAPQALGARSAMHVTTATFVRSSAVVAAAPASGSFAVQVTLQDLGANVLTGAGVAPDGTLHVVTATVTVAGEAVAKPAASGLPFTGSAVIIPGVIIGAAMLAGGFFLLTTVRSRKAGART
jgi:hypothetical protein